VKLGSLCSGIGGLDLGLEAALGAEPAWFCESEEACWPVLERAWPGRPVYPDIRTMSFEEVEPVDVIAAGYPCQPFSSAGRRLGEADPRHLWPAVARAVRALRPRLLVLENVPAHLRDGFGAVLGDLAAAGFDADWTSVCASAAGAPHLRWRLLVLAYPADSDGPRWEGPGPAEPSGRARPELGAHRPAGGELISEEALELLELDQAGEFEWGRYGPAIRRWEQALGRAAPAPVRGRLLTPEFHEWMMGLPAGWAAGMSRRAALRAIGNAVVPQVVPLALAELAEMAA